MPEYYWDLVLPNRCATCAAAHSADITTASAAATHNGCRHDQCNQRFVNLKFVHDGSLNYGKAVPAAGVGLKFPLIGVVR